MDTAMDVSADKSPAMAPSSELGVAEKAQPHTGSYIHIKDLDKYSNTFRSQSQRPLLIHLNADTSWLVSLPILGSRESPAGRSRFNMLIDPWFQGPQSDVAAFFSTQWHVVPSSVTTIAEVNTALERIEHVTQKAAAAAVNEDTETPSQPLSKSLIDVVVISHEFTDHCHRATLEELPPQTPVFATDVAANLIRSWDFFKTVVTIPNLDSGVHWSKLTSSGNLPPFVGIGRATTRGNSLYYHSAILLAFDLSWKEETHQSESPGEVIIYSPHGIESQDIAGVQASGLETLALLHGLHDVRIWMMKQLNLGALNGIKAVRATGAKYWIATHDEVKKGGGIIARLLKRKQYSVKDAVDHQQKRLEQESGNIPDYQFVELNSGDGIVLA